MASIEESSIERSSSGKDMESAMDAEVEQSEVERCVQNRVSRFDDKVANNRFFVG